MSKPTRSPHPTGAPDSLAGSAISKELGHREREVMAVLWSQESATVLDVLNSLTTRLAYTTVMTTLDRLFKKGLLHREKKDRAFIYSATLSAGDLERRRAVDLVRRFFSGSQQRRDVLLSSLVDAVGQYDSEMLDELERKIRMAREHS